MSSYAVFTPSTITKLKANYAGNPAATTFLNSVSAYAQSTRSYIPCAKTVMDIEGNLNSTDAAVINTYFDILIACAVRYQFTTESYYAVNAIQYLLSFSITYIPIGNPITEEVFYKFVAGYDLVKDVMTAQQKAQIDAFLVALYTTAQTYISLRDPVLSHSNYESRNLLLMTAIAYTLGDTVKQSYCSTLYASQVDLNILAAGTLATSIPYATSVIHAPMLNNAAEKGATFDFYHRDAVDYHDASIGGLILAALVAKNNGGSWQTLVSAQGKKLDDGVAFAKLYGDGARTHIDFTNSLVQPFDAGRVATFDPVESKNLVNIAAMVLPAYVGVFSIATLPMWEQILYYSIV